MQFQFFQKDTEALSLANPASSKPRCLQNSLQMRELVCCKLPEVDDVLTTTKRAARNDSAVAKRELGGQMPAVIVLR